jgi:hypothetical protein
MKITPAIQHHVVFILNDLIGADDPKRLPPVTTNPQEQEPRCMLRPGWDNDRFRENKFRAVPLAAFGYAPRP